MARFTVRVELHKGTAEEYERLHAKMANYGFTRTVTSDDGVTYHLPPAEYNWDGDASRDAVFNAAVAAATAVKPKPHPAVVVTESNGRTWIGLKRVD